MGEVRGRSESGENQDRVTGTGEEAGRREEKGAGQLNWILLWAEVPISHSSIRELNQTPGRASPSRSLVRETVFTSLWEPSPAGQGNRPSLGRKGGSRQRDQDSKAWNRV